MHSAQQAVASRHLGAHHNLTACGTNLQYHTPEQMPAKRRRSNQVLAASGIQINHFFRKGLSWRFNLL